MLIFEEELVKIEGADDSLSSSELGGVNMGKVNISGGEICSLDFNVPKLNC